MSNIKIPEHDFLYIVKGLYKGYECEYRSRIHKGLFLEVVLFSNGNEITIPIEYVVFVTKLKENLQYFPNHNGGFILKNLNDNTSQKITKEIESVKRTQSENSVSEVMVPGTFSQEYIEPEYVTINNENVLNVFLKEFSDLLGFDFNNTFINTHALQLSNSLDKMNVVLNSEDKKKFVVAYIFVFLNNSGLGYNNLNIKCEITPNDDPKYIYCMSLLTKFISVEYKIENYIKYLLGLLETKIIPSMKSNYNKTSRIYNNIVTKKYKPMRFPLLNKPELDIITLNVKQKVIKKIEQDISYFMGEELNIVRTDFINNYERYINRENIINNNVIQSYLNLHKELLEIEKNKFYDAPVKYALKNTANVKKNSFKKQIHDYLYEELSKKISKTKERTDLDILVYLQSNLNKILSLNTYQLEEYTALLNNEVVNITQKKKIMNIIALYNGYIKLNKALIKKNIRNEIKNDQNKYKN